MLACVAGWLHMAGFMEAGPADAAKGEMGVHYWLRPCWCTPPAAPVPVEVSGVR